MVKEKDWIKPLGVLLAMVGLGIILQTGFLGFGVEPLSVNLILPVDEPVSFATCNGMGGGCVPPLENPKGTLDYGTCGVDFKCVIPDLCESSGGMYEVQYNSSSGDFDKKCLCKIPSKYDVRVGCASQFQ